MMRVGESQRSAARQAVILYSVGGFIVVFVVWRRVFGSSADAGDCCCPCPPPTPLDDRLCRFFSRLSGVGSRPLLVGWLVGGGYSLRSTLLYSTGWLGSRQDGGSDSMDGWMDWLVRCGVGGIYVFWRSEPQGKAIVVSGGCCCFVSLDTGC